MRGVLVSMVAVLATAFACVAAPAQSETGWPGYVRFEVRAALDRKLPHPRLLAGADDFVRIRESTNTLVHAGCARLLFEADQLRRAPLPGRRLEGRRLLAVSQRSLHRILTLALVYRLTQDTRYSDRAIAEAEAVCGFKDWNPSHFLDTAEMTLAVALAYDWLYDVLTPAQRETLRRGLLKHGLREANGEPKTGGWVRASNNWGQVCHAGQIAGAIALMDEEPVLAEKILVRSITGLSRPMDAFAPSGGFAEGPSAYWPYAMNFNAVALAAITRICGTDLGLGAHPGFAASADYLDAVTGPTGLFFNYSDGGILPDQKTQAKRIPVAASYWLARRFGRADTLVRWEEPLYRAYCADRTPLNPTPRRSQQRLLPLALLWMEPAATQAVATAAAPLCRQIPGVVPLTVQRSGWEPTDWFVALKGGSPSAPHGHMDGGTFVLDAKGVRWASDLGSEDYFRLESSGRNLWATAQNADRWKIFRLGITSHNVPRLNAGDQYAGGTARLASFVVEPVSKAVFDLTALYPGTAAATRTGTLVPGGGYILQDRFTGLEKGAMLKWQMITPARVKSNEKNVLTLVQRGPDGDDVELEMKASDRYARWEAEDLGAVPNPDETSNAGFTRVSFYVLAGEDGVADCSVLFR